MHQPSPSSIPRAVPALVRPKRNERGAAALIVVMLLFFVMSLVAAYTSRNLIFEQRTSTNQYRSTQALEAADAGIEWALAQLNAGRINSSCVQSTTGTDLSFRERYLSINTSTGVITRTTPLLGSGGSVTPRCVLNTSDSSAGNWNWDCRCPLRDSAAPALDAPSSPIAPAFLLRFNAGPRTDLVELQSNSCTRLDNSCLSLASDRGGTGDGVATVRVTLALRGAINRLPTAALTVLGNSVGLGTGASLTLRNSDMASGGVTVHTAAAALPSAGLALSGLPGVAPAGTTVLNDATLAPPGVTGYSSEDRKFIQFFGVSASTYQRQSGLPQLDCSGGCDAAAVNALAARNPGRPLWLTGTGGTLTIDAAVGSSTAPLLLIVEGDVAMASGGSFHGLIYGRKASWTWTVTASPAITGAVIAEGTLNVNGGGSNLSINYDTANLRALRVSQGTFVRVPGSWRDF